MVVNILLSVHRWLQRSVGENAINLVDQAVKLLSIKDMESGIIKIWYPFCIFIVTLLLDDQVKLLWEIWHHQDIPSAFLSSPHSYSMIKMWNMASSRYPFCILSSLQSYWMIQQSSCVRHGIIGISLPVFLSSSDSYWIIK